MAAAVVEGKTVRITSRFAIRADRKRAWPARARMFAAPSPSTSTTTRGCRRGEAERVRFAAETRECASEHCGEPRSAVGGHR